ncbi:MAG: hypothetical protein U0641_13375 [Anaerolineae bacterium]
MVGGGRHGLRSRHDGPTFAQRGTDTLGFVIPTFGPRFSDPFFAEFLAGIGNQAADLGFDLLVSARAPGPQEQAAYRRLVEGGWWMG